MIEFKMEMELGLRVDSRLEPFFFLPGLEIPYWPIYVG